MCEKEDKFYVKVKLFLLLLLFSQQGELYSLQEKDLKNYVARVDSKYSRPQKRYSV